MDDSAQRILHDSRTTLFDVRGWLAGLGHIPVNAVQFVSESERGGRRTVTYDCAGKPARVRMTPVTGAAAWELVAELGEAIDRVVLPGATRFVWRSAHGNQA